MGTRHLTVRYLLTLFVLAGLALTNYLILRAEIEESEKVANVVAQSGTQRALLLRTALLAGKLIQDPPHMKDETRLELHAKLQDLEELHQILLGSPAAKPLPATVQMIYFNQPYWLDRTMREYIEHARKFADAPRDQLRLTHPDMRFVARAALSGDMIQALNTIVDAYQTRSRQRVAYLLNFAYWSFVGTVAVLLASGLFIFRPMVRRVRDDMESMTELNNNLEMRVAQRTQEAERRAAELVISEAALRDQSRLLSSILDNMGDGVMALDSEARIQLLNPKARAILNIPADQQLPCDWSQPWLEQFGIQFYFADGVQPFPQDSFPLIRSLRGEDIDRHEVCVRRGDDSVSWLSITARPLRDNAGRLHGCVAVLRDTTQRKRTEDALRKSETLYRSLVDNLPLYVLRKDVEGRFTWVNENFSRLVDRRADQIIGKTDFDFYPPEIAKKSRADDQHVIDRGIVFHDIEVHQAPGGEQLFLEVLKTPVRDAQGAVIETQTILLDVSSRIEAERRLLQTERLAAIGQMVTGVAHESRNALQQIQACCGLLQWKLNGQPEVEELVEDLQKAQDRLRRMFDDLRGYAAPVKLDLRMCDIRDVVQEAWKSLEPHRGDRNATFQLASDCSDCHCQIDPLQMEQVFRNVFENSLAATKDPVVIQITVRERDEAGLRDLQIEIHDNGPGLTAEQQSRAFEPFYTTKSKGTGLGMAITKRIVEAHQGQIHIGNAPGGGAIVGITLPRGEI